ncbi:MAG: AMP-binding protein [Thermomicrobiales bacterium]
MTFRLPDEPWVPPETTAPACIAWWAAVAPDAPALLAVDGRHLTYHALQEATEAFGRACAALGLGRGDRLLLELPEGMTYTRVLLATMRAATAVPVSAGKPATEADAILAKVKPRAVIARRGEPATFRDRATAAGIPVLEVDADGTLLPDQGAVGPPRPTPDAPVPDELAAILLTSGTTELPRAVPIRHDALLAVCGARVVIREFTRHDRALLSAPASFVVGIARAVEALISGGSAIMVDPLEIVASAAAIRDLQPTWAWMSPALLELVVDAADRDPAIAEWRPRMVRSGGTRIPPSLVARAESLWGVPVLNGYGSTESLGFISAEERPDRIPRKPGSAGQIRPGLEVTIRADNGDALPIGATGEITVRTGRNFTGYLDDPDATAAIFFPGGWYRTGDVGHLDSDGYLFVTGRLREMINRGGEKVAPHEVDDALREHPAIADAAAFAVPDPRLGEEVAAAVVLCDGAAVSPRDLRRWLVHRLAVHKIPRRIVFLDALPRTASGKVQRGALTERYAADQSA